MSLDYQVGFTWFAEWWRVDNHIKEEKERKGGRRTGIKGENQSKEEKAKEHDLIQAAYDAYKEKLQMQMARSFVQQHKNEEWFKERYDPAGREPIRQQLSDFRRAAFDKWAQDMDNGVFDEFTLEGIYKSDTNGDGGMVDREEGEAVPANEVLAVGDLLPTRGGDLRDEAGKQPTLLIKTIAPTVSRAKLESFCKEHLGEGDAGFRWLSLSDPNPTKKYHRIGWVLLNPSTSEDVKMEDEGAEEDAEDGAIDGGPSTSSVSLSVAAKALELIDGKTVKDEERGDFKCHVGIHEPPLLPRKKALWDLFSAPERVARDLDLAVQITDKLDAEMGQGFAGNSKVIERVDDLQGKGFLQPQESAVKPKDDESSDEEGAVKDAKSDSGDDEVDDEDLLAKKKQLDLLVEYLRRVHNFCLFCVFESDSVHELCRKCPGGHLRRPRASLTSSAKVAARASAEGLPFPFKKSNQNSTDESGSPVEEKKPSFQPGSKVYQQLQKAYNWVRTYEDKLVQILDPESVDLRKIGGKPVEDGLEEELSKFVKQEDESKYRCKVPDCTKLFKGQVFWRKHIEKRHEEFYSKIKQEVSLYHQKSQPRSS
jgi:hypothetical protein